MLYSICLPTMAKSQWMVAVQMVSLKWLNKGTFFSSPSPPWVDKQLPQKSASLQAAALHSALAVTRSEIRKEKNSDKHKYIKPQRLLRGTR